MVIKELTLRRAIRSELRKLVLEARKNRLFEQDEGKEEKDVKSVSQFKTQMMSALDELDLPTARMEGMMEMMKALMEKVAEGDTSSLGKISNILGVQWKTGEEKA